MSLAAKTLFLGLLLSLASSAAAQTHRASVRGTIFDPVKAVIQNATIRLINQGTNETRTAVSGTDGEYAISSLPAGTYRLEVAATNFARFEVKDIVLQVNQELRIDASLEVAGITDPQVLVYEPDVLKKDSASIGAVIENRQIEGLPLDGRNFYELTLLVPGATPAAQGSAGSVRGDFSFSVNGAREDSNNFLLDGVYNVDPKLNTFGVRPPVDAIREFEMLTSSYDAAFGRNPGAQVNVILKSGTNEIHGSLFEFHRNAKLDARNYFAPGGEA